MIAARSTPYKAAMKKLLPGLLCLIGALSLSANQVRDFWFAGAEISSFELSQSRYGDNHQGHAELIYVTEPFLTDAQVKHEFGEGESVDVLKLNALRTFNTGIYSYRTMTSTFQPVDLEAYPHCLKTLTSIQDWCGLATQQLNKTDSGWRAELRSYFQKAGDRNFELGEVWLEDELWLRLRLDPSSLPQGEIEIIPGSIFTRFYHRPIESSTAEAKLFRDSRTYVYAVHYPGLQRRLEIEFDADFPHIIRAWKEIEPDGTTTAKLKKRVMHSEYWSENHPKDAIKRKQLGLSPVAD